MFFLISSFCSAVIEKQDVLASGSSEKTTLDQLFSFTKLGTTDSLNNETSIIDVAKQTVNATWVCIQCDYSFTHAPPGDPSGNFLGQVYKYIMLSVTFGIAITLGLYISSVMRGAAWQIP